MFHDPSENGNSFVAVSAITSRMVFNGSLLRRGYWIYAIRIFVKSRLSFLYIGRTGDNSSKHAGSPFERIANHLNLKPSAKSNSLSRLIREKKIDLDECEFRLTALGPFFPEQPDFESHRPYRNRMTAVEKAVAEHFREQGLKHGYELLGKHDDNASVDRELVSKIIKAFEDEFAKG